MSRRRRWPAPKGPPAAKLDRTVRVVEHANGIVEKFGPELTADEVQELRRQMEPVKAEIAFAEHVISIMANAAHGLVDVSHLYPDANGRKVFQFLPSKNYKSLPEPFSPDEEDLNILAALKLANRAVSQIDLADRWYPQVSDPLRGCIDRKTLRNHRLPKLHRAGLIEYTSKKKNKKIIITDRGRHVLATLPALPKNSRSPKHSP